MTEEVFELRTEYIDLLQLLKATGNAATGGDAKGAVDAGWVRVNGEPEQRRRRKLREGDVVELAGRFRILIVRAGDE